MKKYLISTLVSLALAPAAFASGEGHTEVVDHTWSFEGPFGSFDTNQVQRGLQVYTEVCSACHGLKYVGLYSLDDKGGPALPEDQARAYAQKLEVWDDKTKALRPATYSDHFPENTGAGAPDLSLMAKARAAFHGPYGLGINQVLYGTGGPEYIHSLMTHFEETPECAAGVDMGALVYNAAFGPGAYPEECKIFETKKVEKTKADGTIEIVEEKHEVGRKVPGSWISMAAPLSDGAVTYTDGSPETVDQYAQDVAAFLMWTAEPKLNERKTSGLIAVLMLGFLTALLFLVNKALWYPIKHPKK